MTFIEPIFLVFLLASFVLFYICPVKFRWMMLLAISIVFYAIAGVKFLPFIFVTSFSVYLGGKKMGKIYDQMDIELKAEGIDKAAKKQIKEKAKSRCKRVLVLLIVFNIAILSVVKFTKFFIDPINDLLVSMGGSGNFKASYIIVPLGISYYTFSSLSYLMDVYWKRVGYEKNYFRFLLYAIYFPHILQGPIERYTRLGARLKEELRFDYDRATKGLQLMAYGYFKKLVVADRIGMFITATYADYENTGGILLLLSIFLDVVYIYADFSGCMDIARGVSQIFGVELDLNFNHPFSSKSVTEFWRRWHMSLGGWFKDYVYYPVSTSRLCKNLNKKMRNTCPDRVTRSVVTAIPVTVTWVLTGVWHGTGITYVSWGVYYAFMIFMSVSFAEDFHNLGKKLKINYDTATWRFFQMFRTTCIFAGGRLLTRPGTLKDSVGIIKRVFTNFDPWTLTDGSLYTYGLSIENVFIAVIAVAAFGVISYLQKHGDVSVRELIASQNIVFRWAIYLFMIFVVLIFGIYGPGYDAASFVYMAY